ncbi:hypothetical protein JL721_316 [Aureococcus anophagefferens]|nr:hypothetical protein JL721_316 [Aureococcus anophagefferens]
MYYGGEACVSDSKAPTPVPSPAPSGCATGCADEKDQRDYRGAVAETAAGVKCQYWTSQEPYAHDYSPDDYPDAGLGDHNFCRNPDGDGGGAWCLNGEGTQPEWDYCDVPYCEEVGGALCAPTAAPSTAAPSPRPTPRPTPRPSPAPSLSPAPTAACAAAVTRSPRLLDGALNGSYAVAVADLDGDADLDVVAGGTEPPGDLAWYANDGAAYDACGAPPETCVFPFVYAKTSYEACTYDYADANGRAGQESEIPNFKASYLGRFPLANGLAWCATAVDADGAFVEGSGDYAYCYADCAAAKTTIGSYEDLVAVAAADVDGDGAADLAGAAQLLDKADDVVAYAAGPFGGDETTFVTIASGAEAEDLAVVDVDGDADLDVLAANCGDSADSGGVGVSYYEQIAGTAGRAPTFERTDFGEASIRGAYFACAFRLTAADVDGDGDVDVAVVYRVIYGDEGADGSVETYEDDAMFGYFFANGTFSGGLVASGLGTVWALASGDVDGDGDFAYGGVVASGLDLPYAVDVADLDGDGDGDVLVGVYGTATAWYESGGRRLGRHGVETTYGGRAVAGDLDGDGDLDVALTAHAWSGVAVVEAAPCQEEPTAAPSSSPGAAPSSSPSALPTIAPTASYLQITSMGGEASTCVAYVECELLWVYRGDPSACETLTAVVANLNGTVIATDTQDNTGEALRPFPGDADVNEYTLTLTCDGDASVTDSIFFQVSYSPAPTTSPTIAPTPAPSPSPSTAPTPAPTPAPTWWGANCSDSESWHRKGAPSKHCAWVAALPSRCAVVGEDDSLAWEACARSCGCSDAPSKAPTPAPSLAPSTAAPTVAPTASYIEITSLGGEASTCVHYVECELLWVYRGDPSACKTLTAVVADLDGNIIGVVAQDNTGETLQQFPGDADVNEYTLTLTCDDDASVTDSFYFQVSYTPAPTAVPTTKPSAAPTTAAPSATPSLEPSPYPTMLPSPAPSELPAPAPTASYIEITSMGGGSSTCVHYVECELLWVYRGDPSACETLTAVVANLNGTVIATDTQDNTGEALRPFPGDADVNEYTLTLSCKDDASVTDSFYFQVSSAIVLAGMSASDFSIDHVKAFKRVLASGILSMIDSVGDIPSVTAEDARRRRLAAIARRRVGDVRHRRLDESSVTVHFDVDVDVDGDTDVDTVVDDFSTELTEVTTAGDDGTSTFGAALANEGNFSAARAAAPAAAPSRADDGRAVDGRADDRAPEPGPVAGADAGAEYGGAVAGPVAAAVRGPGAAPGASAGRAAADAHAHGAPGQPDARARPRAEPLPTTARPTFKPSSAPTPRRRASGHAGVAPAITPCWKLDVPPPPAVAAATFTSSGAVVLVDLDARSDQGDVAAGVTFACEDVLDFPDVALAECFWVSSAQLSAEVNTAPAMLPGSNLTLLEGALKLKCEEGARCDCYKANNASAVAVDPPEDPDAPVAVFQGTTVAPVCEAAGLDVAMDQSTGSGGRDWTGLQWNVSLVPSRDESLNVTAAQRAAALAAREAMETRSNAEAWAGISTTFHADQEELEALTTGGFDGLGLTLFLQNFLYGSSTSDVYSVALSSETLPSIVVVGGYTSTVAASNELAVEAQGYATSCDGRSLVDRKVSYSWALYAVDDAGGLTPETGANFANNPRYYKREAYWAPGGASYVALVTVTDEQIGSNATASVSIDVSRGGVQALIEGGDRLLSATEVFAVDGSASYDEDLPQGDCDDVAGSCGTGAAVGLAFAWNCTALEGASPDCGVDLPPDEVLSVDGAALGAGTYGFALVVSSGGRRDGTSVTLEVVAADPARVVVSGFATKVNSAVKQTILGIIEPRTASAASAR